MIIHLSFKDIEELLKNKMGLGFDTSFHWNPENFELKDTVHSNDIILEIKTYNYF